MFHGDFLIQYNQHFMEDGSGLKNYIWFEIYIGQ